MKAIVDCNSFYCSCERVFRPDLLNRPVVVLSNNDGCIVSRTDEAKRMGVAMASPYYQNRALIIQNKVTVFSSNYNLYGDLSIRVMDTLRAIVGEKRVEVYSVDEAFLDLDHVPADQLNNVAEELKRTVEQWTGIKVSVGVAPTKVLAKVANRLSKKEKEAPKGIMVLGTPGEITGALKKTAVEDIWGIGYRSATQLKQRWSIYDALQLRNMSEEWARTNLGGVVGVRLLRELNGHNAIEMKDPLEQKKMIATTRMFGKPVFDLIDLKEAVATYTSRAAEKLRRQYCAAKHIQVFVVTNDEKKSEYQYSPQTKNHSTSLLQPTSHTSELIKNAVPLLEKLYTPGLKYLKAGVVLSGLVPDESIQGNMFNLNMNNHRRKLMDAMDNINFSMRDDVVKYVASGLNRNWKMRQEMRSGRYTTRWNELFEIR